MVLNTSPMTLHDAARAMGIKFSGEPKPKDAWLTSGNLRLHYLDWGKLGAPTIVFLHGNSQTAHTWDFASLALSDRYRCIALDQRGHGDSDWDPAKDYNTASMVGDVLTLFNTLSLKPSVVVGLSMGGRNAYSFTGMHPKLVRGLVVVDSGPDMGRGHDERPVGTAVAKRAEERRLPDIDEADTFEAFVDKVHEWNPRRPKEQVAGSVRNNVKQLPNGKWTWKFDKVFRSPERRREGRPRDGRSVDEHWNWFKSITVPTMLVIGAESDVMTRAKGEAMVAAIPHGELVVVENAGHLVPGDNPVEFDKTLQAWLSRLERGAR